jgi:hypothetical protein
MKLRAITTVFTPFPHHPHIINTKPDYNESIQQGSTQSKRALYPSFHRYTLYKEAAAIFAAASLSFD